MRKTKSSYHCSLSCCCGGVPGLVKTFTRPTCAFDFFCFSSLLNFCIYPSPSHVSIGFISLGLGTTFHHPRKRPPNRRKNLNLMKGNQNYCLPSPPRFAYSLILILLMSMFCPPPSRKVKSASHYAVGRGGVRRYVSGVDLT